MGVCTGVSSTCALGGYALESRCHLGNVVLYDTVSKLKWSVAVGNHGIRTIIDLLAKDFDPENGISVPIAEPQEDCVVSRQMSVHPPGRRPHPRRTVSIGNLEISSES